MTKNEIFKRLKSLNVSKIYITFFCEKDNIDIISNIVIMTDGRYSVDWNDDIYKDKSYITEPIFNYDKKDWLNIDGLLTWDVVNKKLIISGEKEKCVKEKFSEEI